MTDYFASIAATVREQGPLIVFLLTLCESIPLVGLAVPGVTVVILAGVLAASASADAALALFAAAFAGIFVGDNLAYWAGRALRGRSSRLNAFLSRHAAAAELIQRQPKRILIFFQFPPYLRMAAPAILGSLAMPTATWLALSLAATLLFVATFFSIGLLIGLSVGELVQGLSWSRLLQAAFAFGFAIWLALLVRRLLRLKDSQ